MIDDNATPIYQSKDTNGDGYLNLTERWTYTATASPTKTVTNMATAYWTDALGLTVSCTDTATVVVTVWFAWTSNLGAARTVMACRIKAVSRLLSIIAWISNGMDFNPL